MSLPTGPSLAELAADEFARRRSTASRKVGAGEIEPAEAEALLRPWLALAARFGADLPELYEDATTLFPFDRAGQTTRVRRLSADLAPPAQIAEVLAAARDVALERANTALSGSEALAKPDLAIERARRLQVLAIAFGCRPFLPATLTRETEAA
jgi:hypothetical protein